MLQLKTLCPYWRRCKINKQTNEILANQVIAESTDNRVESYPPNGKDYLCPLFNH